MKTAFSWRGGGNSLEQRGEAPAGLTCPELRHIVEVIARQQSQDHVVHLCNGNLSQRTCSGSVGDLCSQMLFIKMDEKKSECWKALTASPTKESNSAHGYYADKQQTLLFPTSLWQRLECACLVRRVVPLGETHIQLRSHCTPWDCPVCVWRICGVRSEGPMQSELATLSHGGGDPTGAPPKLCRRQQNEALFVC